jgi:glutathione S-transferase
LEESGADFTTVRVTLADGEHRQPAYLAVNPRGRVPVLAVDDQIITENIAIVSYIANHFPKSDGIPTDDLLAARTYELLSFFASSVHVGFAQVWRTERFTHDESAYDAIRKGGRRALETFFDEIDALAAKGAWLVGNRFTAADTYLLVFYRWVRRLGIDASVYANWTRHTRKMLSRPAVQRALAREGLHESDFIAADCAEPSAA